MLGGVPSVDKVGDDIAKGTTNEIKELQKNLDTIRQKLDTVEKNSGKILDTVEKNSGKILNTVENITEKIAEALYNYVKLRIESMIFIIIFFLFLPHILSLINFVTNLAILFRIKSSDD